MPVTEIMLLRHGNRVAWSLDPSTGKYTSNHPFPTRLPADPPLASHGVDQAVETGLYLTTTLSPLAQSDRLRIYSSLFYRCLETLKPTLQGLRKSTPSLTVRGETGLGEWFGKAWFKQPVPASAARLKKEFFPFLDDEYVPMVTPDAHGERIHELHDRLACALEKVVRAVDVEYERVGRGGEEVTVLICGHAAQIICSGRVLTGCMPDDHDEDDFQCYTCGISRFVRREKGRKVEEESWRDWRTNGGVAGGWDCTANSTCEHLEQGAQRGWHFHGDESFDSYGVGGVRVEDGGFDGTVGKVVSKL